VSRDYRKLRVFNVADDLVVQIYSATKDFPVSERYGLQAQIRRAAVSVATNIVEGSARRTTQEYLHFLNVAAGSAAEVRYLAGLAARLGFLQVEEGERLSERYSEVAGGLVAIIGALGRRA
jgi:four helix bundle protein